MNPSPDQRRAQDERDWNELSRRASRAMKRSQGEPPSSATSGLVGFSVPDSDPDGLVELLEAGKAAAISRWDDLTSRYPVRHYCNAEVAGLAIFTPKGLEEQRMLDHKVGLILAWLKKNLTEGADFEIEGTGASADFHIFFRERTMYYQFLRETRELEQKQPD